MSLQTNKTVSPVRDRIAGILMLIAALGALLAFISSIGTAAAAGLDTQQVEWWRVFGFLLFMVLFVFLALWPRRYPGLWELIILDKAALTVVEFILAGHQAANAFSAAVIDAVLTVFILAAYLLSKGYTSWRRLP